MSAESLLDRNPDPTTDEINEAISGNVCRCTGYEPIVSAISDAAARRRRRLSESSGNPTADEEAQG